MSEQLVSYNGKVENENLKYLTVLQDSAFLLGFDDLEATKYGRVIKFINDNFPKIGYKDLHKAFELYTAEKLNDYLPKDFKHFGKFSAELISKVLNAYFKYKADFEPKEKPIAIPQQTETWKIKQMEKETKTMLVDLYEKYVNEEPYKIYVPKVYVDLLKKYNVLVEYQLTEKDLRATIREINEDQVHNDYVIDSIKKGGISLDNVMLVNHAQRIKDIKSIELTFKLIKENGVDLRKLFEL